MELSQSRPYGAQGRKPTHDFLSLYSHSTAQQDPRPPCQGNYLKTHDFLQVGNKGCAKEETVTSVDTPAAEKPPPPVEHVLPGGIGTYSISHINTYMSPIIGAPKPEGTAVVMSISDRNDESSFCGSYGGSGFALWGESAAKKGKTGKEKDAAAAAGRAGQWGSSSTERPSQSSSNNHRGNFSSPSSSQPSGQRSQSFMDMIKSAKGSTSHEDELEEEEHFALNKKGVSSATTIAPNDLRVKVDGKSSDQKADTPRSKHSATEQRRRSKINDRFKMLRGLIPHGDQKRDKASFLLEVIEYVQFLQDKVQRYEGPYQGWSNEQSKSIPWRNNNRIGESFDHSQGMNSGHGPGALVFATKLDEKPLPVSQAVAGNIPNVVVESDTSTATISNKGMTFPVSLRPNFFTPSGGVVHQAPLRLHSDVENTSSQPQSRSCTMVDEAVSTDKLKEEDFTIEGGTISISSAYSQGLLTTLTQALHSSGVDLSQASLSVQIELGKRAKSRATATTSVTKDDEISPSNYGVKHSRAPSADDSDQVQKKLKTSKN